MGRTLYDKIWDEHVVHTEEDGTAVLYIDRHLVHEVTSPQAFEGLRDAGRKVWRVSSIVATADHNTPTTGWERGYDGITDPISKEQITTLDKNIASVGAAAFFPLRLHDAVSHRDVERGIGAALLKARRDGRAGEDVGVGQRAAAFDADVGGIARGAHGTRAGEGERRLAEAPAHVEARGDGVHGAVGMQCRGAHLQIACARVGELCIKHQTLRGEREGAVHAARHAWNEPIERAIDIEVGRDAARRKGGRALRLHRGDVAVEIGERDRAAVDADVGFSRQRLIHCRALHVGVARVAVARRRERKIDDRIGDDDIARGEA